MTLTWLSGVQQPTLAETRGCLWSDPLCGPLEKIFKKLTIAKKSKIFVSCYTYLEWSSPLKDQLSGSQTWSEKSGNHKFNDQTLGFGHGWVAAHLDGSEDNFGGKVGRDCSWSSLWGIFDSPPPGMSEIILHRERDRYVWWTRVWSSSKNPTYASDPFHKVRQWNMSLTIWTRLSLSLLFSLPSYLCNFHFPSLR